MNGAVNHTRVTKEDMDWACGHLYATDELVQNTLEARPDWTARIADILAKCPIEEITAGPSTGLWLLLIIRRQFNRDNVPVETIAAEPLNLTSDEREQLPKLGPASGESMDGFATVTATTTTLESDDALKVSRKHYNDLLSKTSELAHAAGERSKELRELRIELENKCAVIRRKNASVASLESELARVKSDFEKLEGGADIVAEANTRLRLNLAAADTTILDLRERSIGSAVLSEVRSRFGEISARLTFPGGTEIWLKRITGDVPGTH